MKISKYQLRGLLRARELRDKLFPVFGSMLRSWKHYLVFSVVIGGYSWWAWSIGLVELSFASLGFLVGIIIRDIVWFRVHARMWPINVKITDWNKVDEIINENKT